jgi:hypothetical protein
MTPAQHKRRLEGKRKYYAANRERLTKEMREYGKTRKPKTEAEKARRQARYTANVNGIRDKANARSRAWRTANPERARAKVEAWRIANPDKVRAQRNLPAPTRPRPALCECCGKPPSGRAALALDHDHTTGEFRGWLCWHCNSGLGKFGDTLVGVLQAVKYLEKLK